jgi:hypothetical protein
VCKYCDHDGTGRKQSVISRELRVARKRVKARVSEPDEVEAGHTDDGDGDGDGDSRGVNAGTHVDVAHADAVIAEATSVVPVTYNGGEPDGN